jgi:hypothetical protein
MAPADQRHGKLPFGRLVKPQRQASIREVLARLVERTTYHNTENGFCVLGAKARGIAIR